MLGAGLDVVAVTKFAVVPDVGSRTARPELGYAFGVASVTCAVHSEMHRDRSAV